MMLSLKDEEQNDIISLENLQGGGNDGVDISVDFEIFQRIKQLEAGKGKSSKSMQPASTEVKKKK